MSIKHSFVSAKSDGPDTTIVRPSDWNAEHVVDGGTEAPTSGDWDKGAVYWNTSPDDAEYAGWVCTASGSPGTWVGFGQLSTKVKFTVEGGLAIKLTNKTGTTSVKGTLVSPSTATDNAFILQANMYDTIGVVYEGGIADGSECWVVIAGRCQVLLKDSTAATRGYVMLADTTDGRAIEHGTIPPTNDSDHFKECGHFIETKSSGTNVLAYAIIHFN